MKHNARFELHDSGYDRIIEVPSLSGCFMFMRVDVLKKVGGFDERFFAHNEEIDLCWRLYQTGRKIFCFPQSTVYHVGGGTLPKGNPRKTFLNFRNNLIMLYKNLPADQLVPVMRVRMVLDYVAALAFVLKGQLPNARAVLAARREYAAIRKDFRASRDENMKKTILHSIPEQIKSSILVQFYAKGRKSFSSLKL